MQNACQIFRLLIVSFYLLFILFHSFFVLFIIFEFFSAFNTILKIFQGFFFFYTSHITHLPLILKSFSNYDTNITTTNDKAQSKTSLLMSALHCLSRKTFNNGKVFLLAKIKTIIFFRYKKLIYLISNFFFRR